jgi:hypothetical protein
MKQKIAGNTALVRDNFTNAVINNDKNGAQQARAASKYRKKLESRISYLEDTVEQILTQLREK